MKFFKRTSLVLGLSLFALVGAISFSSADGEVVDIESTLKPMYLDMIDEDDKIEYVKQVFQDGSYLESYRDKKNKREQVDLYNAEGTLVTRDIVTNAGAKIITIGLDENNEYVGISWDISEDIAKFNSEILGTSIIETSFEEESRVNLDTKWVKSSKTRDGIDKYSSPDGNIYIDTKSNVIVKREFTKNSETYQSIEYDLIDSKIDLFEVDSLVNDTRTNKLENLTIEQDDVVPGKQGDTAQDSVG